MKLATRLLSILTALIALCGGSTLSSASANDVDISNPRTLNPQPERNLELVSFVSWWSHDAVGYHPAIVFNYENVSGRDLAGQVVHFQARFTDLRNGYVTVARKEVREQKEFVPGADRMLVLHGPSSFELPIDQANWPQMECKVMCRVGDVDDSGTENLILARLESIVMTDEEAEDSLRKRNDIRPPRTDRHRHRADHGDPVPPKPLAATQLSLNSPPPKPAKPQHVDKKNLDKFLAQGAIAGLGDNFLQFETTYKQQPARADEEFVGHWTWIRYTHEDPNITVFVGTKTNSADVLVIRVRAEDVQSESQIAQLAKAMSGKFKSQPLAHFQKSVSYRPGLRVEMSSLDAAGYRVFYVNPSKEDNNYIVIMSRLLPTKDQKTLLPELFKRTQMLKFATPLFGDPEQE